MMPSRASGLRRAASTASAHLGKLVDGGLRRAASTASAHLGKLVDGGLLSVEQHGRHRYFRLAGPAVAKVIESPARISPATRFDLDYRLTAAIAARMLELGWVSRMRSSRALLLSDRGSEGLRERFGLELAPRPT